MEVLAAICLFSFVGTICFGVLTILLIGLETIFEGYFIEGICEKVVRFCFIIVVIGVILMVISAVILLIHSFINFQPLEVSE